MPQLWHLWHDGGLPASFFFLSQRESHERESKGTRGLVVLVLQVALDFSNLTPTLQGVLI